MWVCCVVKIYVTENQYFNSDSVYFSSDCIMISHRKMKYEEKNISCCEVVWKLLSPFGGHFVTTDIFTSHFHLLFCSPFFSHAIGCSHNFKFSCMNFEIFQVYKTQNKFTMNQFFTDPKFFLIQIWMMCKQRNHSQIVSMFLTELRFVATVTTGGRVKFIPGV